MVEFLLWMGFAVIGGLVAVVLVELGKTFIGVKPNKEVNMSFLTKLFDVAKGMAPGVIGGALAGGPVGAGAMLVKGIANQILGKSRDSEVTDEDARRIIEDPALYMEFKTRMEEIELGKMQEYTKRLEAVNTTMQAESVSGSRAQRLWRPFNGFLFGSVLCFDYCVAQIAIPILNTYTRLEIAWQHIPGGVYSLWALVLGAAVVSRGKEKIEKTRQLGSAMNLVDTAKTFVEGVIGR